MKILTTLLISLPLICAPLAAAADKAGSKGPSERAWERANDNASFKRGDDNLSHEHHDREKKKAGDRDREYSDRNDRYRDRESDDRNDRDRDKERNDRDRDRANTDSDNQDNSVFKSINSGTRR